MYSNIETKIKKNKKIFLFLKKYFYLNLDFIF
jgi:hypothetical protein